MRKLWIIPFVVLFLSGCNQNKSFETILDQPMENIVGEKMVIMVDMPDNASLEAMESNEECSVYICDDYTMTIYTTNAGDIHKTIQNATGFLPEHLDIIETNHEKTTQYICAWAAAGESGEQVGRCAVIDDGSYHYVLTAMADAENAGTLAQNEWLSVFRSFRLIHPEEVVSSGS